MNVSLVVAMSKNRVIGKDNEIPWPRHKADMQHFRKLTLGKVVIMGRKTFESIGRPLQGRANIVVSGDPFYKDNLPEDVANFTLAGSLRAAIGYAHIFSGKGEIMVIGGRSIYEQALPRANKIYLTIVGTNVEGDTHMPRYSPDEWVVDSITCKYANKDNPFHLSFVELSRK